MRSRHLATAAPFLALGALLACADGSPTAPAPSLARAYTPEQNTYHIPVEATVSCAGFDVGIVGTLDVRQTVFFDRTGTATRVHEAIQRRLLLTNLSTGKTREDFSAGNQHYDLHALTVATTGRYFLLGGDTRARDVGRVVYDLETGEVYFSAGPRDAGESRDLTPLICAELALP
jgi:hypothetical protein